MTSSESEFEYPWYGNVRDPYAITQGAILTNFPVPVMKESEEFPYFKPQYTIEEKVIVITQACDLEQGKVNQVAVCPLKPLSNIVKDLMDHEYAQSTKYDYNSLSGSQKAKKQKIIDSLRQGNYLDYYLLNKNPEADMDYQIVMLRHTYLLPKESFEYYLKNVEGNRFELLPPYREHLAQAYSRNFMRIGLPIDLRINEGDI